MNLSMIALYISLGALALLFYIQDKKLEKLERKLSSMAQMQAWWEGEDFTGSSDTPDA